MIESFKLGRSLDFFKIMEPPVQKEILSISALESALDQPDGQEVVKEPVTPKPSQVDRIWLGFQTGDQEAFQYDGETQVLSLVESEKQKEHESPLSGMDYNRKQGLVISSCEGGSIRIWNCDKKFLREIALPHKADSVCFFNAEGDILVSHEKRVSLITSARYKTGTFDYVAERNDEPRLVPVTDEILEDLKLRDMSVREKKAQRSNKLEKPVMELKSPEKVTQRSPAPKLQTPKIIDQQFEN